jgi:hypothetical protein
MHTSYAVLRGWAGFSAWHTNNMCFRKGMFPEIWQNMRIKKADQPVNLLITILQKIIRVIREIRFTPFYNKYS